MLVKPFHWNLKKVSSEETRLLKALFEFLPETSVRAELGLAIRKTLLKHLGEKVVYYLDAVNQLSYNDFLSGAGEPVAIAVLGLAPIQKKMVIEIDGEIAHIIIDHLLGGEGTSAAHRTPTDAEQGVLQYLIMQLLGEVYKLCGASTRVHFRFERFVFDLKDASELAEPKDMVALLTYKVVIKERAGFVKLAFPNPFALEAFLTPEQVTTSPGEAGFIAKAVGSYDFLNAALWAEAGVATLEPTELSSLDAGDVIIFDETGLTLADGKLSGNVYLRAGSGVSGGFRAVVRPAKGKVGCTIVGK